MRQIDDYFDNIPHGLQVHQLTTTRYKTGGISILERILRDKKVKDDDFKGRNNLDFGRTSPDLDYFQYVKIEERFFGKKSGKELDRRNV